MIEWIAVLASAGLTSGFLLYRVLRHRALPGHPLIADLVKHPGEMVTIEGRVQAVATRSPLSLHPCAAWWCWVIDQSNEAVPVVLGAAAHGEFRLVDSSGSVALSAAQCRANHSASQEYFLSPSNWYPQGSSAAHDELRRLCQAAGVESPEQRPLLKFKETLLPVGAVVRAVALVVRGPGDESAPYREGPLREATLGPPPGGFIELELR